VDARVLLGAALALSCAASSCATLSCATGGALEERNGRLHHRELGFAVASPVALTSASDGSYGSPRWERSRVDGAVLAYHRPGALMSLQATCGRPLAPPKILAWHLMIGSKRTLRASGPVTVGLVEGWTLTFDTLQEGVAVRVKTVTLVYDRCSYDWILSAQRGFEASERSFDAWWQSFEPDAAAQTAESPG
jgi:hypothetical protein